MHSQKLLSIVARCCATSTRQGPMVIPVASRCNAANGPLLYNTAPCLRSLDFDDDVVAPLPTRWIVEEKIAAGTVEAILLNLASSLLGTEGELPVLLAVGCRGIPPV